MKYWGPINSPGGINGNDPYINGNPSIGVQGSIPTFQSFEQPLRGLQNLIMKSMMNPDATIDDLQITTAIRSQRTNWTVVFGGTNNALTATFDPAPNSLASIVGMPIRGVVQFNNTGPATLTTNLLLEKPITHPDGTPLSPNDLIAGQIAGLMYDGTKYQYIEGCCKGAAAASGPTGPTGPSGGSGATGPGVAGGYHLIQQPYFFARALGHALVGNVATAPPWVLVDSDLGDMNFYGLGGQAGVIVPGPNTIGKWLLYATTMPWTNIPSNKIGVWYESSFPMYLGGGVRKPGAICIPMDWSGGFTNHVAHAILIDFPASGYYLSPDFESQYTITVDSYFSGIRVGGGPPAMTP